MRAAGVLNAAAPVSSEIRRAAREEGMTFLRESAPQKAVQGVTTLREINQLTFIEV